MAEAPETPKVARKLAAILAADIAGYSSLMGANEEATVSDLKAHQAVILPMIGEHGGRVIDTAGDGILAEFASAVNAVKAALNIQKAMGERNKAVNPVRRMQFRIGVNLGDVVFDDTRVYGDGVNVAARLEAIAEPGGICISDKVRQETRGKIEIACQDIGEHRLKNIAEPVRIFRVQVAIPQLHETPALSLPDKPSIAVLPFANMSGDPAQEYFSDGITEDIITELSRFSELFVIARNSSFQYKGKSPDIRQVGRELGVRYVLEGSIRRSGERVRITGQLIDAATGVHRWAERYDRKVEDVFQVQDEVARTIAGLLAAHVNRAEAERILLKPPATWQAHDYYLRAAQIFLSFSSSLDVQELYQLRAFLERSLEIDPNYPRALALLADSYLWSWTQPLDRDFLSPEALERAHNLSRKAVQFDPTLFQARAELAAVLAWKQEHDLAISELEKAVTLNPGYADWRFALVLLLGGEFERAIETSRSYMRFDPFYRPQTPAWSGMAHYMLKDYDGALRLLRECVSRAPNFRPGHVWLAATYAQMGQMTGARAEAAEVLRLEPNYSIERTSKRIMGFKHAADAAHFVDGLRKAGLPE
jgi:adenylate cyclase